MKEFFEFACSGFWTYIGVLIIISIPGNIIVRIWKAYLKHKTIKSIGWPPSHLDVNGNFKPETKIEQ
jgi:hypothetical protein